MKYVFIIIVCAVLLLPTWLMIKSSVESSVGLMKMPPSLFPRGITFYYWGYLLTAPFFWRWTMNTVLIAAGAIVGCTTVTMMAGFALQRKLPGDKVIMGLLVVSAVLPTMVLIIPRYLTMRTLGVQGGWIAAVLPLWYAPITIMLVRGWMLQIGPGHFEEARVEGANEWQILWKVAIPMTTPLIALMVIGQGINALQDFLWQAMTLVYTDQHTLIVGLTSYLTQIAGVGRPNALGMQMTVGTIILAPMLVIFFVGSRWFIGDGKGLVL